jgi:hypothetical protein
MGDVVDKGDDDKMVFDMVDAARCKRVQGKRRSSGVAGCGDM